jgi:NlpC/P60 family putative phage cell wall peptidase
MSTANTIIPQARTWLNTPFHHQGRRKHEGCDCIGLIIGVVAELGVPSRYAHADGRPVLLAEFDERDYAREPDGLRLRAELLKHLTPVPNEAMQVGDILLFRFRENPQHVAFLGDYPGGGFSLIHCYQSAGRVVEHFFDEGWRKRLVGVFRINYGTHCVPQQPNSIRQFASAELRL